MPFSKRLFLVKITGFVNRHLHVVINLVDTFGGLSVSAENMSEMLLMITFFDMRIILEDLE